MPPKTIGVMRGLADKAFKVIKDIASYDDMHAQQAKDDQRLSGWIDRVGEERATEAWNLLKSGRLIGETGIGSTTLPELLAEAWLQRRGVNYVAQVDLMFSRPDFVLLNVLPAQSLVWRIQGNYWHSKSQGKDEGQKLQLLSTTVRGLPVGAVVDLWESSIYDSPGSVFDAALRGQSLR